MVYLGYELPSNTLLETVAARMERLYGWKVKPEWVVPVTGIVSGFNIAARDLSVLRKMGISSSRLFTTNFMRLKNNLGFHSLRRRW